MHDELNDFVARHAKAEQREWDQVETDAIMRDMLEEGYADHMPPRPPEETIRKYMDAIKRYHAFCVEADLGNSPLKAGPVAAYLHHLKLNGVTALKLHADAISYVSKLNEVFDPTTSSLVQAVLRSMEGNDAQKNSH